ncbi:MAG TPA: prepilin-type N-terminal cleavage/methylation domain-containing protein [Nitrospirae bacterium]|nr:hypothetical protein BMS3Abin06_02544 [bacterium BMS3Abin06]HDH11560.1 prepilin-type N-terminal cleavage/methylation domain-containing protein [Nitrospirota bacterium]HDL20843.1 prepilin-type N-terminal cleavage/methylation domain-containing protein [Nitrospirota bacterium]HDZ00606.1 prepilin-type N-terminal cleavage/methylation domain-containing protein [Nitrospirota bacterium]
MDMMNIAIIREKKGITLVELVVVMSIIAILAAIGVPEYGRFAAKSSVRRAASDLLQNMRLARTMAIKENRTYLITFNESSSSENIYRIGFDGNGNGSLLDTADGYGNTTTAKVINIQNEYGNDVVLDTGNFAIVPPNNPDGNAISNAINFNFLPDGSANPSGTAYLQHIGRGYAFCVELVNAAGLIDLFMWEGDEDDTGNTGWTEIN